MSEGDRLPAERELSAVLGVSRAELRKALLGLELDGRLVRHVGRGTFLKKESNTEKGVSSNAGISTLAERTAPLEAMAARLALEPELARLAAMHATPRQLRTLKELTQEMRRAGSWVDYERLDSDFHDKIAAASGNSLLHEVHKIVNGVRQIVVWRRLDTSLEAPPNDYHSFDEHDVVVEALHRRAGADAQSAMRKHLQSTLAVMTSG